MPREFQSVRATAMRNVSADVQEKYLTEIPRVRNMTDHIFISGKILRHLKRYAYIYIHTHNALFTLHNQILMGPDCLENAEMCVHR